METLKTGVIGYYDAHVHGLIPCKVLRITRKRKHSLIDVEIKLTASVGPYKTGEVITTIPRFAIPQKCIIRKKHSTVVIPYRIQADSDEPPAKPAYFDDIGQESFGDMDIQTAYLMDDDGY